MKGCIVIEPVEGAGILFVTLLMLEIASGSEFLALATCSTAAGDEFLRMSSGKAGGKGSGMCPVGSCL